MTLHGINQLTTASSHISDGEEIAPMTMVMWPCGECGAEFTLQSKLERHQLSHRPRIIVITPSGLRLNAQQVTLHNSDEVSASAVMTDASDSCQIYPSVDASHA